MTITDILVLLLRFKAREITTKYLLGRLDEDELQALFNAERARQVMKEKETMTVRPPVQEAPPEVDTKIHQMFEGVLPAGSKEQFHAINRQGKHCFDDRRQREAEQGIFHVDQGSSPFSANLPGRCVECGQVILKGDLIVLRAKEQGAA